MPVGVVADEGIKELLKDEGDKNCSVVFDWEGFAGFGGVVEIEWDVAFAKTAHHPTNLETRPASYCKNCDFQCYRMTNLSKIV